MLLAKLATKKNLELAWRRITTGGNGQYKNLYRGLYHAYEIALRDNLKDLRQRLLGGAYQPSSPERMYVPKASGLHRPITLLCLEDQIVLQAFANLAAQRVYKARAPLQSKVVFSNILERPDSIFFFRRWQETYAAFQARIDTLFDAGLKWVGDFDLAAFYDTVSHDLLIKSIYPRASDPDTELLKQWLRTWSSDSTTLCHGHGLPQGPIASDFLAECFLLPVDAAMRKVPGYIRYVDDVRLLGRDESVVRVCLILLEKHCRERGLIPQVGKFAIKLAGSAQEAMGMLPSIADPQRADGQGAMSKSSARTYFEQSVSGKPSRVSDKTRLRFLLYRASPDSWLTQRVLRLAVKHPEHADAFFAYIGRCGYSRSVERECAKLVKNSPYSYVRGEAWHVLARSIEHPRSGVVQDIGDLAAMAARVTKKGRAGSIAERWGAWHFLCKVGRIMRPQLAKRLQRESSLLMALLKPALPEACFGKDKIVAKYLKHREPEAGLSVCSALQERGLTLKKLGLAAADVARQSLNVLRELGIAPGRKSRVDPISEIMLRRYGVAKGKSWRKLLGAEYGHAIGILKQAEAAFDGNRSLWLGLQNSFNQVVFIALQGHLNKTKHAGARSVTDKNGHLIDFGVTLDANSPFGKACPTICGPFRGVNTRRNQLPSSHPYEKKTAAQARHLSAPERRRLIRDLRTAYCGLAALMP